MKKWYLMTIGLVMAMCVVTPSFATDLGGGEAIEVKIHMGTKANEFAYEPQTLNLEVGKLYKLVFINSGRMKHEWTAPEFVENVWVRKVEFNGVELKFAGLREVELLKPGAQVEVYLVPIRPVDAEMACEVEGHKEAGMVGRIIVK